MPCSQTLHFFSYLSSAKIAQCTKKCEFKLHYVLQLVTQRLNPRQYKFAFLLNVVREQVSVSVVLQLNGKQYWTSY